MTLPPHVQVKLVRQPLADIRARGDGDLGEEHTQPRGRLSR